MTLPEAAQVYGVPIGEIERVLRNGRSSPSACFILTVDRARVSSLPSVIPEIDIWRAACLMLKHYGDDAELESARRADELWESGDAVGAAVWRRIIDAVGQLTNATPPGAIH